MVTAPTVVPPYKCFRLVRLLCNAQTNNYATISISIYFYSNCQRDGTRGTYTQIFTNVDIVSEVHEQYKLEKK